MIKACLKHFIFGFTVFSGLYTSSLMGQEKRPYLNQNHFWFMYAGNHQIHNKFSVHTLYHIRRHDFLKNWQQNLVRLGINYHLNEDVIFSAGYDNLISYPYTEFSAPENKLSNGAWQTITLRQKIQKLELLHRYRSEQNWTKVQGKRDIELGQKLRYMLTANLPLKNKWFLSFFDEIFVDFGKNTTHHFSQNRIYGGMAYQIDGGNIQLGYMNQLLSKANNTPYESNHTLVIMVNHSLNFVKD